MKKPTKMSVFLLRFVDTNLIIKSSKKLDFARGGVLYN